MDQAKQTAIQFSTPQVSGRILQLPGVLPMLQLAASRLPFLSCSTIAVPDAGLLERDAAVYHPLCTGICGTDVDIVRLKKGSYALSDIPTVFPLSSSVLLSVQKLFGPLFGLGNGRMPILSPFTLGHEIVALDSDNRLGVVYPIFSCRTKFDPERYCDFCRNEQENLCSNIHSGDIRGLSFGTGAVTGNGTPLNGGMQEVSAGSAHQFIPADPGW